MMTTTPEIIKIGIILLLLVCATIDLWTHRIPNALTYGGAIVGLLVNLWLYRESGLLTSVTGWLAGVAILAIPFVLRGIGGGDVKLLAAIGAWGGPLFAVYAVFYGALAGAVVAIGFLIWRGEVGLAVSPLIRMARWRVAFLLSGVVSDTQARVLEPKGKAPTASPMKTYFPFGPALAIGGIVALFL
jgi:prepilin peptidase CpaA